MSRKLEMWELIRKDMGNGQFWGKIVVDYGCGYGELSEHAVHAGAAVRAIDKVWHPQMKERAHENLIFIQIDIDEMRAYVDGDIAFCFSVLPYLKDPNVLLMGMAHKYERSYIECQYAGDGPGFDNIHNDFEMSAWLSKFGFATIMNIGKTYIPGRDMHRTIWRCERSIERNR